MVKSNGCTENPGGRFGSRLLPLVPSVLVLPKTNWALQVRGMPIQESVGLVDTQSVRRIHAGLDESLSCTLEAGSIGVIPAGISSKGLGFRWRLRIVFECRSN